MTQHGDLGAKSTHISIDSCHVLNIRTRTPKDPIVRTHENTIMATELAVQSERAFQKQPHVFLNSKRASTERGKNRRIGKGQRRWYKDVGLGFRTPKTAIEGNYIGMYSEVKLEKETDKMAPLGKLANSESLILNRQEMPLRRRRFNPRPYPHRHRCIDENAPNPDHPS